MSKCKAAIDHDRRRRYSDVPEYYPLFLCAIHTEMRAGELAGFQWPAKPHPRRTLTKIGFQGLRAGLKDVCNYL